MNSDRVPSLAATTAVPRPRTPSSGSEPLNIPKRRAILVLGMHRSGTSALTRTLSLCGAALPKRRMRPAPGNNETGFWESRVIRELHDELLATAGLSWGMPSELPLAWFETPAAAYFKKRMISAFHKEFGDAPLIVVKDPRACSLVPFWLTVFDDMGIEPGIVIPVRRPSEVAVSLEARDGMPQERSLLLWLQHFLAAEHDSRMVKRSITSYAGLLESWRDVVNKIGTDLALQWPDRDPLTSDKIDDFLCAELRHHVSSADLQGNSDLITSVRIAYRWAIDASMGKPMDTVVLDGISDEFFPGRRSRLAAATAAMAPANLRRPKKRAIAAFWELGYTVKRAHQKSKLTLRYLRRNGLKRTVARIAEEFGSV